MKKKSPINFYRYSRLAFYIAWALLLIGAGSFINILLTESSLSPSLSSRGFEEFFRLFGGPLSFLGASLVLFAAWLTLVRTENTQTQIDLLGQNNRFNNYYKHIEQFKSEFNEAPFMTRWFSLTGWKPQRVYMSIYREFYYQHPLDFAPKINPRTRKTIDEFLKKLEQSTLNKTIFQLNESSDLVPLVNLSTSFGDSFKDLLNHLVERDSHGLLQRFKERGLQEPESSDLREKFNSLNTVFLLYTLFCSLLVFDGEGEPDLPNVTPSYNRARAPLGI